jgi:hypothetical protein
MDDLILAARLFEKQYAANLEDQGLMGRAATYGKNVLAGAAGRITNPLAPYAEEGQAARYTQGVQAKANRIAEPEPTSAQAANIANIDPNRIADPACATCGQPAQPGMSQCANHAKPQPEAATTPPDPYLESLTAVGATGLAPEDTAKRTETTTQTLATTGENAGKPISTETNVKDQTVADLDGDGDSDADDEAIAAQQSPDPNTIATNATPTPSGPTSAVPPMNTASTTTQNAAGAAQVANAQKLANTGSGGLMANIATMGGAALMGGINRWRGNRKLNALANAQPGAGGATNANMIRRADGTEFLDDHWNLQKARMEARERGTTEAIRNAYR